MLPLDDLCVWALLEIPHHLSSHLYGRWTAVPQTLAEFVPVFPTSCRFHVSHVPGGKDASLQGPHSHYFQFQIAFASPKTHPPSCLGMLL